MKYKVTASTKDISCKIASWAQKFNLVRKSPGFFACPDIEFDEDSLRKTASDLLKLKILICDLPRRLGLSRSSFLQVQGMPKDFLAFAENDASAWKPRNFRPDCIITRDGLKVIEMNIDNGALAIYAGIYLKSFFNLNPILRQYWQQESCRSVDEVLQTFDLFANDLKNKQTAGLKIFWWDLKDRTQDLENERTQVISALRKKGLEVSLILGEEILAVPCHPRIYVFRAFPYVHFFNERKDLQELYTKIPYETISQGDLGVNSALYDNKVNLALLRSSDVVEVLSQEELDIVQRLVPDTCKLDDGLSVAAKALHDKDSLICKAGVGFQGKQVKFGSECSNDEWACLLKSTANVQHGWTIQNRVEPVPLSIQVTNGQEWKTLGTGHIVNFFFVGDCFAGTWVRISNHQEKIGAPDGTNTILALPRIVSRL